MSSVRRSPASAVRASGRASLARIYAVVLETNEDLSVIGDPPAEKDAAGGAGGRGDGGRSRSSLLGVTGWAEDA